MLGELRQAQDRILMRQKLAELGELTAGVAHQIRNPLNFMKNFSEASEEMLADLKETLDGTADELNADTRALINGISDDLASNLGTHTLPRRPRRSHRSRYADAWAGRRQYPGRRHKRAT